MVVKVPVHTRQITPQVGTVPTPVFPQPVREAFGEDVARAKQERANVGFKLAELLGNYAIKRQEMQSEKIIADINSGFRRSAQDKMFNKDEETVNINGQDVTRPAGIMNRQFSQASGSTKELDQWFMKKREAALAQAPGGIYKQKVSESADSLYSTMRGTVISYEAKQERADVTRAFISNKALQVQDAYAAQDPLALERAVASMLETTKQENIHNVYDEKTAELNNKASTAKLVQSAMEGAMITDRTGNKARFLLKSIEDKLPAADVKKISDAIDVEAKRNAVIIKDELNEKFLNGTLTIPEIMTNSQPKEQGGLGGTLAKGLVVQLEALQKREAKDITDDDIAAEEYVGIVDLMLSDKVDNFNAKQILVDAWADGVVDDVEKEELRAIRKNLDDTKWNKKAGFWRNKVKAVKRFFGKNNPDNKALATALRKLIGSKNEDLDEATDEIIRGEYNSLNPDKPISKDADVMKEINVREEEEKKATQEKANELFSQIQEFNPLRVGEAEAGEEEATPLEEEQQSNIEEIQKAFEQQMRMNLQIDILTPQDVDVGRAQLLDDAIDIISGGMSIEEAEAHKDAEIKRYKQMPSNLFSIVKDTGVMLMDDIKAAQDFLLDPIGTLGRTFNGERQIKRTFSDKSIQGFSDILEFTLGPFFKKARGIGGLLFPEEGDFLEFGNGKARLTQAVKDMLKDPRIGYISKRIGDDVFTGEEGAIKGVAKVAAVGITGTIAELLTFNPRSIFNRIKNLPAEQRTARMGEILAEVKKDVPKHRQFIRKFLEAKGETIYDKALANFDEFDVIRFAETNTYYGHYLKSITERIVPRFSLASQRGMLRIGSEVNLKGQTGKIVSIEGVKATIDIAGKNVLANLAELTPTEAPIVEPGEIPQGEEGIVEPEAQLIEEAKKYKTAEEFVEGDLGSSFAEIKGVSPDDTVTVYRASEKGGKIESGNFVTTNRQQASFYAKDIVGQRGAKEAKIVSAKVKAGDIRLAKSQEAIGVDDAFIYRPVQQLTDIWNKAQEVTPAEGEPEILAEKDIGPPPEEPPKFPGVQESFLKQPKPKTTILQYFTPAEYHLKQLGFDAEIGQPVREALQDFSIELMKKNDLLRDIQKEHHNQIKKADIKASDKKVWTLMDKGIPEGDTSIEATTARKLRVETEEMLARINELNKRIGREEVREVKNYIIHMLKPEILNEIYARGVIPPELAKVMEHIPTKNVFLRTAIERKGVPEEWLVKNPYELMKAMYAIDLRYIHLQDALNKVDPYLKAVKDYYGPGEDYWRPETYKYLDDWVKQAIKMRPSNWDTLIDNMLEYTFAPLLRKVGLKVSHMPWRDLVNTLSAAVHTGALGMRIKPILRNLVQSTFDWVYYGTGPYVKGSSKFLTKEGFEILNKSKMWKTRMPFEAQDLATLNKIFKTGSLGFRFADLHNVGKGLLTRYYHAVDDLKMSPEEAIKWADDDLPATQWSYRREDLPRAYWTTTGRAFWTLGSWWMNFYTRFLPELMRKAITGKDVAGRIVPTSERLGIMRLVVLAGVLYGVKEKSKELTGTTIDYTGSIKPTPLREAPIIQLGFATRDIAQGIIDGDDRKLNEGMKNLSNTSKIFIPWYLAGKDLFDLLTGKRELEEVIFYQQRKKKKRKTRSF